MRHSRGWGGAVPMFLTWRKPDHVPPVEFARSVRPSAVRDRSQPLRSGSAPTGHLMNEAHHVYVPPKPIDAMQIPSAILSFLDGNDLPSKSTSAIRLSTVDEEGWPHASLLSVGEVLALPDAKIRFAIFPKSSTTANLLRDGRLTLTVPYEKGMCEMRMRAQHLNKEIEGVPLSFFEAEVLSIRQHVAVYADVLTGVTFSLHEPQAVFARWDKQIAALRSL